LNRAEFVEIVKSWEVKSPNNVKQNYTERLKDNCKRLEIKPASDYKDFLLFLADTMRILAIDDFDQVTYATLELTQKLARANNTIEELRAGLLENNQPSQDGQNAQNGQVGGGQGVGQEGQAQNQNRNNFLNSVGTRLANRQTH
jgi:hypothetical protein